MTDGRYFKPRDEQAGVDLTSRHSGLGQLSTATHNVFFGLNHRGAGNPIPLNADNQGLTFFTRPNLNLSYDNLSQERVLTPLLTAIPESYQAAVRDYLDPRGSYRRNRKSPLVDIQNPFMPLLSNNLLSLSGWRDPILETYSAKEGTAKESWSMADDVAKDYGTFDLSASFRNLIGDPITLLFNTWRLYMARVYDGTLIPHPESIVEHEIDYQTGIYRLILDPSRRFVQKIARTIAFPTGVNLGSAFNYSSDTVYNQENNSQINIQFRCIGVEYNDPILVSEFNAIVEQFNENMKDQNRERVMHKVDHIALSFFNYYGYPHIDINTFELQWWVSNEDWQIWEGELKRQEQERQRLNAVPQTLAPTTPNTPPAQPATPAKPVPPLPASGYRKTLADPGQP